MIVTISRTKIILERLKKEGKTSYVDPDEYLASMVEMNEVSERTRREFRRMDKNSEIEGRSIVVY